MFPLTRPVRQGLATGALLMFTVLPTALVAMYAWRINRPGHIRDVEIELGRQLGLQVTLEAVRYPRPGEVVYQGVVLRQEEPRGKGLTRDRPRGRWSALGPKRPRADAPRREPQAQRREPEAGDGPGRCPDPALRRTFPSMRIHLAAPTCELDLVGDALRYSLQDLAGEFLADRSNPTLRVAYRLAEPGSRNALRADADRDRSAEPARTSWCSRRSRGLPLPARVLDVFFDSAGWLGPTAKVEGTLTLGQVGGSGLGGRLPGQPARRGPLDPGGPAVPAPSPLGHGSGRHRRSARWGDRPGQGTGWREARGELIAGTGSIGVDLLDALAREMKFRLLAPGHAPRPAKDRGRVPLAGDGVRHCRPTARST